jgi:hypothetical protein
MPSGSRKKMIKPILFRRLTGAQEIRDAVYMLQHLRGTPLAQLLRNSRTKVMKAAALSMLTAMANAIIS